MGRPQKYPEEWKEFQVLKSGELPAGWADVLPRFTPEDKGLATRLHSQVRAPSPPYTSKQRLWC